MIGIAGAVGANALLLAVLLTMHGNGGVPAEDDPGFAAIITASLDPPPPEPDAVEEGASAEPSRGETAEPSRPQPERPVPIPTPARPAPDAGAGAATGVAAGGGAFAATQASNSGWLTTRISMGMKAWSMPQSSEHWP